MTAAGTVSSAGFTGCAAVIATGLAAWAWRRDAGNSNNRNRSEQIEW
jgi:hypothetical protein